MKKALLIAIPLVITAGCGTKTIYVEATTSAPATTEYVPQRPQYTQTREDLFLDFIRSQVGSLWGTELEAIDLGYAVCDSLRNGASMYDMEDAVAQNSEPELVAAIVISAVMYLCPDQEYKAQAYANANGV